VAAHSTRPGPSGDPEPPRGHRQGPAADDDVVREAGGDR
jgi:hypothetical protein